MAKPCTCLKCVEVLLNPDPCQCKDCVDSYKHNVCPFQYGFNSAMREALNAYQSVDPIWKAFEAYVDNSQERMKPP